MGRSERGEGSEEGPCELFLEQREVCTSLRECRTQEAGNVKASSGSGRRSCHLVAPSDYKELRLLKTVGPVDEGG